MQEAAGENKHAIVTDNHNNRTLHSGALNDFQYVRRRIASREKRPKYDAQWKIKCGKVLEVNTKKNKGKAEKTCMSESFAGSNPLTLHRGLGEQTAGWYFW